MKRFFNKTMSLFLTLMVICQSIAMCAVFAEETTYDYDVTENVLFGAAVATTNPVNSDNSKDCGAALCDGKVPKSATGTTKWFVQEPSKLKLGEVYAEFEIAEEKRVDKLEVVSNQTVNDGEGCVEAYWLQYFDSEKNEWVDVDRGVKTDINDYVSSVEFNAVTAKKFRVQIGNKNTNSIQTNGFRITEIKLYEAEPIINPPKKLSYTVTRLKPSGNANDTYTLFNDGYFMRESVTLSNSSAVGRWSSGYNADAPENSMVLKLDSVSDLTNIILYGGGADKKFNIDPDKVTIKYSDCCDASKLKNGVDISDGITWNELPKDSYTISNVINETNLPVTAKTVPMGAKGETVTDAKLLERSQQVLAFNLKEKINAGSLYIVFDIKEGDSRIDICEVELYNRGTDVMFGKKVTGMYPEVGTGKVQSNIGSGVSELGLTLTDSQKDANWGDSLIKKWTVKVATANFTPYVEYDMNSEEINRLMIYSGRIGYGKSERVDGTKGNDGIVDPNGVVLTYTEDGTVWKTIKTSVESDIASKEYNGNVLTLKFGKITPKKLRIYVATGTWEQSTDIQTPSWFCIKEIEAYNNVEDTAEKVDTFDILRADADVKDNNPEKRSFDTLIEENNNKLLARDKRNIMLSMSSPISDSAVISINNGATVEGTTVTSKNIGGYGNSGEMMYFASADIKGLKTNTNYTITITDGDRSAEYSFTTSDKTVLESVAPKTEGYENIDVYLAIGQSNMAGRAAVEEQDFGEVPNTYLLNGTDEWERAQVYPTDAGYKGYQGFNRYSTVKNSEWESSNGLNSLTTLAKGLKPSEKTAIGFVSNAKGDTSIERWAKGYDGDRDFDLYEEAVRRAKAAIAKGGRIKGIIWHQGCANSGRTTKDAADSDYVTKFSELMNNIRTDLGDANGDIPVFVCELPAFGGNTGRWNNMFFNKNTVPQLTSTVKNTYSVYSAGAQSILTGLKEGQYDNIHMDSASQRQLGYALADKINSVVYKSNDTKTKINVVSAESSVDSANANKVSDGINDAYTISDTDKMWSFTPTEDSSSAAIELGLDGVYNLSDIDIYFNDPWVYKYGYKVYTKTGDNDWSLRADNSNPVIGHLKQGRASSESLNGVLADKIKIELTGKEQLAQTTFNFDAQDALETAESAKLIGITEIELFGTKADFNINKFDFSSDFTEITAGGTAKVDYDISKINGDTNNLTLIIGVYDNAWLVSCTAEPISFADGTNKSGTVSVSVPQNISENAHVKAVLVKTDNISPLCAALVK